MLLLAGWLAAVDGGVLVYRSSNNRYSGKGAEESEKIPLETLA
jgi:hypothetical protein